MKAPMQPSGCRHARTALHCRNERGFVESTTIFRPPGIYQLFGSINGPTFSQNEPIEHANLTVAALHKRALGIL